MTEDTEELKIEEPSEKLSLRPDVLFTINSQKLRESEDYDLEEEEDGFHCHECGWRSLSLPMGSDSDNIMDAVCPECGAEGVENKLSTHVDEIKEIFEHADVDDTEFIPYSQFKENFDPPQARLDEALNHLATNESAYVVFEDGEALINISRE